VKLHVYLCHIIERICIGSRSQTSHAALNTSYSCFHDQPDGGNILAEIFS